MKVELRDLEIELIAENNHEREALVRLHKLRQIVIKPGRSSDTGWPPDPRVTNIILIMPDSNDWGT